MNKMYSMTAFARAEREVNDHNMMWEIKSVNYRYLETSFRLPESLRGLEQTVRERIRRALKRGKVDCVLKVDFGGVSKGLMLDNGKVEELLTAFNELSEFAPKVQPLSAMDILQWPGVMQNRSLSEATLNEPVLALFDKALSAFLEARSNEGGRLKQILEQQLDLIVKQVQEIRPLADSLVDQQRQRLLVRVAELGVTLDQDRLEQEVVLLAQKADVREELDRLMIHVEEATSLITGEGPHGRRLDFLTQELNREANTLAAKSIKIESARAAVDLKVIIEQIREQVQNIE
jgi:uncharacterized protein (TIGR00255 family)